MAAAIVVLQVLASIYIICLFASIGMVCKRENFDDSNSTIAYKPSKCPYDDKLNKYLPILAENTGATCYAIQENDNDNACPTFGEKSEVVQRDKPWALHMDHLYPLKKCLYRQKNGESVPSPSSLDYVPSPSGDGPSIIKEIGTIHLSEYPDCTAEIDLTEYIANIYECQVTMRGNMDESYFYIEKQYRTTLTITSPSATNDTVVPNQIYNFMLTGYEYKNQQGRNVKMSVVVQDDCPRVIPSPSAQSPSSAPSPSTYTQPTIIKQIGTISLASYNNCNGVAQIDLKNYMANIKFCLVTNNTMTKEFLYIANGSTILMIRSPKSNDNIMHPNNKYEFTVAGYNYTLGSGEMQIVELSGIVIDDCALRSTLDELKAI